MKILVTGGAGYVGIPLADRLLERGHEVTILDSFMYGCEPILYLVSRPGLRVVKGDIRNEEALAAVDGQDAVFHLAAISGAPACAAHPHACRTTNVDGTEALVRRLAPGQRLIYASTTSVYGVSRDELSEESPVRPLSEYARSKWEAERLVLDRHGNAVSLRLATIFGVSPRMRSDLLVNDFAYRGLVERALVLFEGRARRVFLHVRDAVEAYLLALDRFDDLRGGVYNVGSPDLVYSKREIADAVARRTGCAVIESDLVDTDPRDFRIRFDKFRDAGFRASRTLEEGIDELVALYAFYRPRSNDRHV